MLKVWLLLAWLPDSGEKLSVMQWLRMAGVEPVKYPVWQFYNELYFPLTVELLVR